MYNRGIECANRPCSFGGEYTAEIFGELCDGVFERKDCDKNVWQISGVEEEAVLGESFLVRGIFCGYGRNKYGPNKKIREISGGRGETRGEKYE